jgi:hypothetical protein
LDDNIKTGIRKVGYEDAQWIQKKEDRIQFSALMNLWIQCKWDIWLARCYELFKVALCTLNSGTTLLTYIMGMVVHYDDVSLCSSKAKVVPIIN